MLIPEQDQDVADAEDVIPILEAAIKNPSYRSTVSIKLK